MHLDALEVSLGCINTMPMEAFSVFFPEKRDLYVVMVGKSSQCHPKEA